MAFLKTTEGIIYIRNCFPETRLDFFITFFSLFLLLGSQSTWSLKYHDVDLWTVYSNDVFKQNWAKLRQDI